jgi:hypothetical protein
MTATRKDDTPQLAAGSFIDPSGSRIEGMTASWPSFFRSPLETLL